MKQSEPADGPGFDTPVLALHAYDHRWWLYHSGAGDSRASGPEQIWSAPARTRMWTRFAFDVNYSVDPRLGSVRVYVDTNGDGDALDRGERSHVSPCRPSARNRPAPLPTGWPPATRSLRTCAWASTTTPHIGARATGAPSGSTVSACTRPTPEQGARFPLVLSWCGRCAQRPWFPSMTGACSIGSSEASTKATWRCSNSTLFAGSPGSSRSPCRTRSSRS